MGAIGGGTWRQVGWWVRVVVAVVRYCGLTDLVVVVWCFWGTRFATGCSRFEGVKVGVMLDVGSEGSVGRAL